MPECYRERVSIAVGLAVTFASLLARCLVWEARGFRNLLCICIAVHCFFDGIWIATSDPPHKRKASLVVHHAATIVLCAQGMNTRGINTLITDFAMLELSSTLMTLARTYRRLKVVSMLVWAFQRLVWAPMLVIRVAEQFLGVGFKNFCLNMAPTLIITQLGIAWTAEAIGCSFESSLDSAIICLLLNKMNDQPHEFPFAVILLWIASSFRHATPASHGAFKYFAALDAAIIASVATLLVAPCASPLVVLQMFLAGGALNREGRLSVHHVPYCLAIIKCFLRRPMWSPAYLLGAASFCARGAYRGAGVDGLTRPQRIAWNAGHLAILYH